MQPLNAVGAAVSGGCRLDSKCPDRVWLPPAPLKAAVQAPLLGPLHPLGQLLRFDARLLHAQWPQGQRVDRDVGDNTQKRSRTAESAPLQALLSGAVV